MRLLFRTGLVLPEEEAMSKIIPMRASGRLCALGLVVVLPAVLGGDLAAAEPVPGRPGPPPRPFFGVPAVPSPIPIPFSFPNLPQPPILPGLPVFGGNASTDRCLVVARPIDPRSLKVAASMSIDPSIFAAPRVQGLPIEPFVRGTRR
jgi:hypothetical protein